MSKFAFFDSDQFIAKLSRSHQFDLQQFIVFADFFQELKIDLYQNQPHMLIMCESWATGNFIVNLLYQNSTVKLPTWKYIDKKPVFYLTEPLYRLFIILIS